MPIASGRATASMTEAVTVLDVKFVIRSASSTMTARKTNGLTLENIGESTEDIHAGMPMSALPMKEPRPMIEAINMNEGQLTDLTASPQSRIFSPSTLMKFMRNSAASGGRQLLILPKKAAAPGQMYLLRPGIIHRSTQTI